MTLFPVMNGSIVTVADAMGVVTDMFCWIFVVICCHLLISFSAPKKVRLFIWTSCFVWQVIHFATGNHAILDLAHLVKTVIVLAAAIPFMLYQDGLITDSVRFRVFIGSMLAVNIFSAVLFEIMFDHFQARKHLQLSINPLIGFFLIITQVNPREIRRVPLLDHWRKGYLNRRISRVLKRVFPGDIFLYDVGSDWVLLYTIWNTDFAYAQFDSNAPNIFLHLGVPVILTYLVHTSSDVFVAHRTNALGLSLMIHLLIGRIDPMGGIRFVDRQAEAIWRSCFSLFTWMCWFTKIYLAVKIGYNQLKEVGSDMQSEISDELDEMVVVPRQDLEQYRSFFQHTSRFVILKFVAENNWWIKPMRLLLSKKTSLE